MKGLTDIQGGLACDPTMQGVRTQSPGAQVLSELESEIRHLYLKMMDEPVPGRFLGILRAGLINSKA